VKHPNGQIVPTTMSFPFMPCPSNWNVPSYKRQIRFKRVDIYGKDFGDKDFYITLKGKKSKIRGISILENTRCMSRKTATSRKRK